METTTYNKLLLVPGLKPHVCLDEEEEQQAAGLQQVVQQVELHRDHVPLPPPGLGSLAQPHHILVLKLRKSGK